MLKRIVLAAAGISLVTGFGLVLYANLESPAECDVCYRPMHEETYYRIHLTDGETLDVCCPRCGLRFQKDRQDVVRTEVTDFDSKKRIDAQQAFYVENSPVHFCSHAAVREDRSGTQYEVTWDRCLPSLIAFESREAAAAFRAAKGGVIKTYGELIQEE